MVLDVDEMWGILIISIDDDDVFSSIFSFILVIMVDFF